MFYWTHQFLVILLFWDQTNKNGSSCFNMSLMVLRKFISMLIAYNKGWTYFIKRRWKIGDIDADCGFLEMLCLIWNFHNSPILTYPHPGWSPHSTYGWQRRFQCDDGRKHSKIV